MIFENFNPFYISFYFLPLENPLILILIINLKSYFTVKNFVFSFIVFECNYKCTTHKCYTTKENCTECADIKRDSSDPTCPCK